MDHDPEDASTPATRCAIGITHDAIQTEVATDAADAGVVAVPEGLTEQLLAAAKVLDAEAVSCPA
jgi:hypothetical protein